MKITVTAMMIDTIKAGKIQAQVTATIQHCCAAVTAADASDCNNMR
jgi:hypothetical protein